jgi:hypothetical protein
MHFALGYSFFPATTGYHLERALRGLGHTVSYVGPPAAGRAGFGQTTSLVEALAGLATPADLFWWVDSGGQYFPAGIEDLPIPTACYVIDVHLGRWRRTLTQFFDAVFVAQKDFVPAYRAAAGHDQVHWLPLAAAPDYHHRLDLPLLYDVGFVGNQNLAHQATPRSRRLRQIAGRYRTNDFFRFYPPETIGHVYSQSRIVFNNSLAGDVNMRVFEATASGALLVTDAVANGLEELFSIGRELITYADDAELWAKLDYYLSPGKGEAERAAVAAAGMRRAQAEHTYAHRAEKLLKVVGAPGFERCAAMRRAGPGQRWRARRDIYARLAMLEALVEGARAEGRNPLKRAWAVLPALLARLLRE